MKVAQKRNAVKEGMFYFRKDIFIGRQNKKCSLWQMPQLYMQQKHFHYLSIGCNPVLDGTASAQNGLEADGANEEYTLMSIDTIINGKVIIILCCSSRSSSLVQQVAVLNNNFSLVLLWGLYVWLNCNDFGDILPVLVVPAVLCILW